MKEASQKFISEMNEPFKNKWLVKVMIGAVNNTLQSFGNIITDEELNSLSSPINDLLLNKTYTPIALFERETTLADGTPIFYSKENYSGVVFKREINKDASITFKYSIDESYVDRTVDELILDFDVNYPKTIKIKYDTKVSPYYETLTFENEGYRFQTKESFKDITYLEITMSNFANDKMLIMKSMSFGEVLIYDNEDLTDGNALSYSEATFFKSDELPYKKANIVINNQNDRFNIENPDNELKLLDKGQTVYFMVGYEFSDGTQEYVQGQKLILDSWTVDEQHLTLSVIDKLNCINDSVDIDSINVNMSYRKYLNKVLSEGYEDIFDLRTYDKFIPQGFPVIYKGYRKEALLMMANAFQEILTIDTEDKIHSKGSFTQLDMPLNVNMADISNENSLIDYYDTDENQWRNYATFEKDYVRADGSFVFPMKNSNEFTGLIGNQMCDEDGNIEENMSFRLAFWNRPPEYFSMVFVHRHTPQSYKYKILNPNTGKSYYESNELSHDVRETDTIVLNLKNDIPNFDNLDLCSIEVTFLSVNWTVPYNTIHLKYVKMENMNAYELNENQYVDYYPHIEIQTPIRNMIIKVDNYQAEQQRGKIFEQTITFPSLGSSVEVEINSPCFDIGTGNQWDVGFNESGTLSLDNGEVTVSAISGKIKHVRLTLKSSASSLTQPITLYAVGSQTISTQDEYQLAKVGDTLEMSNNLLPMAYGGAWTSDIAEWYAREEAKDKLYSFNYMGNPILETGDNIKILNKLGDEIIIRIEKHELTFSAGGLRGYIEGRKI